MWASLSLPCVSTKGKQHPATTSGTFGRASSVSQRKSTVYIVIRSCGTLAICNNNDIKSVKCIPGKNMRQIRRFRLLVTAAIHNQDARPAGYYGENDSGNNIKIQVSSSVQTVSPENIATFVSALLKHQR